MKDLWALRLQLFREKISEPDSSAVFSSQPETETETERKDDTKAREWKVQVKGTPTLIQSLGICYLGAILLRLPVSLGDFHRYTSFESRPVATDDC